MTERIVAASLRHRKHPSDEERCSCTHGGTATGKQATKSASGHCERKLVTQVSRESHRRGLRQHRCQTQDGGTPYQGQRGRQIEELFLLARTTDSSATCSQSRSEGHARTCATASSHGLARNRWWCKIGATPRLRSRGLHTHCAHERLWRFSCSNPSYGM